MPVIGFLDPRSPEAFANRRRAFTQGLKDAGFVEGENLTIEYRFGDNQIDRLPELAADLVHRRVAVIAAVGGAAFAAKSATTTIPVVFIVAEDPVRLGLVTSLARPGGNLTGINFFNSELVAKRLEILHELVPAAVRIAIFVNPRAPDAAPTLRDAEPAARAMGLKIQVHNASSSREIDAAFATFAGERPDALFVSSDAFFTARRVQMSVLAARHGVPTAFQSRDAVEAGGLMSYGPNQTDTFRQTRRLYRPHPQGREARGYAGGADEQIRAGHQRPDGTDARSNRAAITARPRRRGDRIGLADGNYWH